MLWAYCLENLLKAVIVSRGLAGKKSEEGTIGLPKVLHGHDLVSLAKTAGIEYLVKDYSDVLAKLSHCSTWYGRYPVPLRPSDLENEDVDFRTVTNVHVRDLDVIYTSIRSELDRDALSKEVEESE